MNAALRTQRALALWALLGLLSFGFLPWYFLQQGSLAAAMPSVWAGPETASALMQAVQHGRPWLWFGLAGLFICWVGLITPVGGHPKRQGVFLVCGALLGLLGITLSGFAIGAVGWSFEFLEQSFGPIPQGQYGMGWGAAGVLLSLTILLGAGLARWGYCRGDVFIASAVTLCVMLLALFVVYPVCRSLASAFYSEANELSLLAVWDRIGTPRIWSLNCLNATGRCGVAWNTLGLALATAAGTTLLGTLIALWAERSGTRLGKPLNALALMPIITPPFVVGLGLILLFGRSGLVNQAMEWAFGIPPTRWFYGVFGIWLAQMFAFTPIAFMIMRGVVQGVSPSLEEASQTLRATRMQTFWRITLPLLKPGLANAFLVGFIESMADFGNPIILGGQFSVLSTEIFFAIVGAAIDPGMAAALSLVLTVFALAVFVIQRQVLSGAQFTTVSGKGDAGIP
ncbi:MAG: iron ABC transporter permease, partial [Betaproteobacteria bacterium]|nr:iron ABC transporter permease [Betaproteobacteria bacterium]